MKELIQVRVQYASRHQCCKTHKRPLPLPFFEFLTAEKVPPIEIHRRMQAVYGDQCVDVSTVRLG